jgi:hypothetical protein
VYPAFLDFIFIFHSFSFSSLITPAMQSTLGTAGASRDPRGVLNGALAEQLLGLIRTVSFLLFFERKRKARQIRPDED